MFEKLTQMLQNLQSNPLPFDPAQFGDPVAIQTNWEPLRGGGSNFRTYKLVQVNPSRVEFKSTVGAVLFSLIFALPGIALLVGLFPNINWSSIDTGILVGLLLGLIFAVLGGYMFYLQMLPIVFDKQEGFFWKKRRPDLIQINEADKNCVRLEFIHALQIIAEYISGKNGGYYSYELNLVLKNGDRVNVVDHGKRKKLAEDGQVLAEFLGIPLWDATVSSVHTKGFSVTGNMNQ